MGDNEPRRGFIWSSKAWYAEAADCKHQISFGMFYKEGGTTGEMVVTWHTLNNRRIPRLECFDDAWGVLGTFTDLLQELAVFNNANVTEQGFVNILTRCGFEDMTPYVQAKGE